MREVSKSEGKSRLESERRWSCCQRRRQLKEIRVARHIRGEARRLVLDLASPGVARSEGGQNWVLSCVTLGNQCHAGMMWREPCIVFSPHYSLRLGPVVHLLRRWHADNRCLLILEEGIDSELALLPFKTLAIRVLQCSFLSGIKLQRIQPLLKVMQPKLVLFPEVLKCRQATEKDLPSVLYYSENVTLHVPSLREAFEACLVTDLALQLKPKKLTQKNMAIARLTGQILLRNGQYFLVPAEKPANLSNQQLLHWGSVDPVALLHALQEKGIKGSIERGKDADDGDVCFIQIMDPGEAVVETSPTKTVICTSDESMAAVIYEVIGSVCNGI